MGDTMSNKMKNIGYTNFYPSNDYFYLMIELKAISMALEGGF